MKPRHVAVGLALLGSAFAGAWGRAGHRIIAGIAERKLTPHARAEVRKLLATIRQKSLVEVANFLDDATNEVFRPGRGKYDSFTYRCPGVLRWHFTMLPLGTMQYQSGAIGTGLNDAVSVLPDLIATLRSSTTSPSGPTRIEALWSIVHLVGDLHQPLNVGSGYYRVDSLGRASLVEDPLLVLGLPTDRGITSSYLKVPGKGNFISVWGTDLVRSFVSGREETSVMRLLSREEFASTPGSLEKWPALWAVESCAVAKRAYQGIKFGKATIHDLGYARPSLIAATIELPGGWNAYISRFSPVAGHQMALAGDRLADLLNSVWP